MNDNNKVVEKSLRNGNDEDHSSIVSRLLFTLITIGVFFLVFYAFNAAYKQKKLEYKEKLTQVSQLEQEITKLEKENKELKREINYLNTNEGVEAIAREKLGLIKPKEIAFVVVSSPVPSVSNAPVNVENKKENTIKLKKEIMEEVSREDNFFKRLWNRIAKIRLFTRDN